MDEHALGEPVPKITTHDARVKVGQIALALEIARPLL